MIDTRGSETERKSLWQMILSSCGTRADRLNQYWFTAWTLAWAITYVAANMMLKTDLGLEPPMSWLIALAPDVFALAALTSYMRFLRRADELMRRIQLEGLAFGFGAAVLFISAWPLLEKAGAPVMTYNNALTVMMFSWVAGQLLSLRRYS